MDANQKKATVRRYYDEIWGRGNVALVDQLMSADYENLDPATPGNVVKGQDAFKALVASYKEAFPDLRFEIVDQLVDGDVVISRWLAGGTHRGALMGIPPTGRRATDIEGITLSRFVGDRIAQDRVVWDTAGLLRRLGVLPG